MVMVRSTAQLLQHTIHTSSGTSRSLGLHYTYRPAASRPMVPPHCTPACYKSRGVCSWVYLGHLLDTAEPPLRTAHTPEVVGPPGASSQLWILKVRSIHVAASSESLELQADGQGQGQADHGALREPSTNSARTGFVWLPPRAHEA